MENNRRGYPKKTIIIDPEIVQKTMGWWIEYFKRSGVQKETLRQLEEWSHTSDFQEMVRLFALQPRSSYGDFVLPPDIALTGGQEQDDYVTSETPAHFDPEGNNPFVVARVKSLWRLQNYEMTETWIPRYNTVVFFQSGIEIEGCFYDHDIYCHMKPMTAILLHHIIGLMFVGAEVEVFTMKSVTYRSGITRIFVRVNVNISDWTCKMEQRGENIVPLYPNPGLAINVEQNNGIPVNYMEGQNNLIPTPNEQLHPCGNNTNYTEVGQGCHNQTPSRGWCDRSSGIYNQSGLQRNVTERGRGRPTNLGQRDQFRTPVCHPVHPTVSRDVHEVSPFEAMPYAVGGEEIVETRSELASACDGLRRDMRRAEDYISENNTSVGCIHQARSNFTGRQTGPSPNYYETSPREPAFETRAGTLPTRRLTPSRIYSRELPYVINPPQRNSFIRLTQVKLQNGGNFKYIIDNFHAGKSLQHKLVEDYILTNCPPKMILRDTSEITASSEPMIVSHPWWLRMLDSTHFNISVKGVMCQCINGTTYFTNPPYTCRYCASGYEVMTIVSNTHLPRLSTIKIVDDSLTPSVTVTEITDRNEKAKEDNPIIAIPTKTPSNDQNEETVTGIDQIWCEVQADHNIASVMEQIPSLEAKEEVLTIEIATGTDSNDQKEETVTGINQIVCEGLVDRIIAAVEERVSSSEANKDVPTIKRATETVSNDQNEEKVAQISQMLGEVLGKHIMDTVMERESSLEGNKDDTTHALPTETVSNDHNEENVTEISSMLCEELVGHNITPVIEGTASFERTEIVSIAPMTTDKNDTQARGSIVNAEVKSPTKETSVDVTPPGKSSTPTSKARRKTNRISRRCLVDILESSLHHDTKIEVLSHLLREDTLTNAEVDSE